MRYHVSAAPAAEADDDDDDDDDDDCDDDVTSHLTMRRSDDPGTRSTFTLDGRDGFAQPTTVDFCRHSEVTGHSSSQKASRYTGTHVPTGRGDIPAFTTAS